MSLFLEAEKIRTDRANQGLEDGLSPHGPMNPVWAGFGLLILCVLAFLVGMMLHRTHKRGTQPSRGPELWLIFPDTGDGDSMLARDPATDHTVLIDSGGSAQAAQQILACARQNGITHLDGILLLSTRNSSIVGLPYLIGQIPIDGPVLLPADPNALAHHGGEAARTAMNALTSQKLRVWKYSRAPVRLETLFGEDSLAHVQFLVVPPPSGPTDLDSALALRIDYGADSALYTAALEPSEENRLVASDADDLSCDVLAVADGGSAQAASSEFLALAAPRVATITNSAEHPPADDTLARLQAAGVAVGQTHLLSNIKLRMGHFSEEPILWSSSLPPSNPQTPAPQAASSP
jgi:beta-lactamase superfamily II metal-dependent hydrolase